jgi:glycosyltransferase involved in cell wall biosynthesis
MSTSTPGSAFYLLVHTEQPLDPQGPNSGAEMASLNQARFLAKAGRRVVLAASLVSAPAAGDGVEYWDLGPSYDVEAALDRADREGPYHLISAGRCIALFLARKRKQCITKLLVTHDRTAGDSGIKPHVLSHLVDAILCVSNAQKTKLASEGAPAEKMVVIHNGVDFDIFAASPPVDHDPHRLVFSGALVPDKGLHLLLNSFVELQRRYKDLKLEVFGDASLWARKEYLDIDTLARSIPNLTFHGKTAQTKIADGFRRSGICVVPSIWFDPFPLTSLEAQGCGCPVVTFNVGGLPEGIDPGRSGIVVEQIEQSALTRALDVLLGNPRRLAEMSAHSARFAREQFRWDVVVGKIVSLCERGSSPMQQTHWYLDDGPTSAYAELKERTQRAVIESLTREPSA